MKDRAMLCPAKINLYLDVGRKRSDGYHSVSTVIQTIDLFDEVTVEDAGKGIKIESDSRTIPLDSSNLCWKAAELLREEFGMDRGVGIRIEKRIPVAAGLGGGSSDAAGVLILLNRLWGVGLSTDEILSLSSRLGSDVPFFITGGTALCTGRGEKVKQLEGAGRFPYVLVTPPVAVSTEEVYASLSNREALAPVRADDMVDAVMSGNVRRVAGCLYNRLEQNRLSFMGEVKEIKQNLLESGSLAASMSGSGPSVFGLFESESSVRKAAEKLREKLLEGYFIHSGTTLNK